MPLNKFKNLGTLDPASVVDDNWDAIEQSLDGNLIYNGDFRVAQSGASFSSQGYTLDGHFCEFSGTVTREAFAAGQTDVPGGPSYFLRVNQTSAQGAHVVWRQPIENVMKFSGKQVTLSFWIKADKVADFIVQERFAFGSGGSPSSAFNGSGGSFSTTTSWQRIVITRTLDDLSSYTLGTNGDDYFAFQIIETDGQTFQLDIADVQVISGPLPVPFFRRPYTEEYLRAARYYWRGMAIGKGAGFLYAGTADTLMEAAKIILPVKMRAAPTLSIVTAPTYTNCSHNSLLYGDDGGGFLHRVDTPGAGRYRASGGVYEADARL